MIIWLSVLYFVLGIVYVRFLLSLFNSEFRFVDLLFWPVSLITISALTVMSLFWKGADDQIDRLYPPCS